MAGRFGGLAELEEPDCELGVGEWAQSEHLHSPVWGLMMPSQEPQRSGSVVMLFS